VFYNIGFATLGNIVGGALLVGGLYWVAYHKKADKAASPVSSTTRAKTGAVAHNAR
jgi:hypothetical protein